MLWGMPECGNGGQQPHRGVLMLAIDRVAFVLKLRGIYA